MNLIVTGINRSVDYVYSDDLMLDALASNTFDIDFIILKDNKVIESSTQINYVGNLSFDEAERVIKELLNE